MIRKYHNHKPQTTPWHCSIFCTTVPFFSTTRKKRNSVFFVPLFRFLHHCSVFSTTSKNGTVCFLYHCSVFCTTVPFFPQREKTEQCVFCTTVPFFALLISPNGMKRLKQNVCIDGQTDIQVDEWTGRKTSKNSYSSIGAWFQWLS